MFGLVGTDPEPSRAAMSRWVAVAVAATLLSLAFVANVVWAVADDRGIWQLVGLPAAGAFWYWVVSVAWERSGLAGGDREGADEHANGAEDR